MNEFLLLVFFFFFFFFVCVEVHIFKLWGNNFEIIKNKIIHYFKYLVEIVAKN